MGESGTRAFHGKYICPMATIYLKGIPRGKVGGFEAILLVQQYGTTCAGSCLKSTGSRRTDKSGGGDGEN